MKKLRIISGIIWAIICLIVIIALFPGLTTLSQSVSKLPFMRINPNYTGGDVARQIISGSCTLDIRKPVFDGLIREQKTGFVQVDWRGKLPEKIQDTIDFNSDNKPDFIISIDSVNSSTDFYSLDENAASLVVSTPTSYGWSVRVKLKRR